jgi:hypothetical protein
MQIDPLSKGLDFYEKIINLAPASVKRVETPYWFSIPMVIIVAFIFGAAVRISFGNMQLNPYPQPFYEVIISIILSLLIVRGARWMFGEKDKNKIIDELDVRDDALSEVRRAMQGRWLVKQIDFSSRAGLIEFDFSIDIALSDAKKLFIRIDRDNDLKLWGEFHNISLNIDFNNAQINIMIMIEQRINHAGVSGQYKYLYDLKWTKTESTDQEFGGAWYQLDDLGPAFKAQGECRLKRAGVTGASQSQRVS